MEDGKQRGGREERAQRVRQGTSVIGLEMKMVRGWRNGEKAKKGEVLKKGEKKRIVE